MAARGAAALVRTCQDRPSCAILRHSPPRSTPAGSPTTRLAAAARSRAPTRRTWRRRSTTSTARRTCRAPKRPRLGAACRCRLPPARLLALVGVAPLLHLVAPGCATHPGRVEYELRGPYGREGLRSQVRGRPGATRGFGRSPLPGLHALRPSSAGECSIRSFGTSTRAVTLVGDVDKK